MEILSIAGQHPLGETGHVDISHVRHVIQAMREAGATEAVFRRSEQFLRAVQKDPEDSRPQPSLVSEHPRRPNAEIYDGGFYISPIVLAANKGQPPENADPAHWHSYATATCDGVLALLAAGVAIDDRRVQDARQWLEDHRRIDYPQGIPPVSDAYPLPWGKAIQFYHYAVRAEAYAALDWRGDWREPLRGGHLHLALRRHRLPRGADLRGRPLCGPLRGRDLRRLLGLRRRSLRAALRHRQLRERRGLPIRRALRCRRLRRRDLRDRRGLRRR